MSILYRWLNNNKSIMSFIFHPMSTWDGLYNVLYEAFDEIHTVNHPVDVVIDLSRLQTFSTDMMKELYFLAQLEHVNLRYRLLISSNPLLYEIFSAFERSYPVPSQRLHLCSSMEDVHRFLDDHLYL